ncbi:MAG: MFS transporter [Gemmatimonadetes bacterium]|nr:MFS transporter [Gemmatimonadota bacterium]
MSPHASGRRGHLLRALRHRNYRLFFGGQSLSLVGTWITRIAVAWLTWRLTHSAAMLGIVGFAGQIPTFLLGSFAGVWVDRLDRYKVLVTTQVLAMVQSFALAALAIPGVITIWEILALQAFQGVINAFDTPSRQSFLIDMIEDKADLSNAIALNSSMVNAARLVGPSVAGVLIAVVGEGWCFFLDGVTYFGIVGSLLAMHVVRRPRPTTRKKVLHDLADGFRYAFGFVPIRAVLMLLATVSLAGMPYTVLLPVIAAQTLHGGSHTLGFLMGASGVGALCGALVLASRTTVVGLGGWIPRAAATFGAGLMAVGLSRWLPVSLLVMVVAGFGFMVQMASSNTIIQTLVREDMRGRVMAFYAMSFMGMAPFGSLTAGAVAARIGAPWTVFGGGAICVLGALVFSRYLTRLREIVRPIYVERGILPVVAEGLGSATSLREEAGP